MPVLARLPETHDGFEEFFGPNEVSSGCNLDALITDQSNNFILGILGALPIQEEILKISNALKPYVESFLETIRSDQASVITT